MNVFDDKAFIAQLRLQGPTNDLAASLDPFLERALEFSNLLLFTESPGVVERQQGVAMEVFAKALPLTKNYEWKCSGSYVVQSADAINWAATNLRMFVGVLYKRKLIQQRMFTFEVLFRPEEAAYLRLWRIRSRA